MSFFNYGQPFTRPAYNAPRTRSNYRVSAAQVNFLTSLCEKHTVPAWVSALASTVTEGDLKGLEVSQAIDAAKSAPWTPREVIGTPKAPADKGYYKYDGAIYTVVASKRDPSKSYAKILVHEGNRGHWDYVKGMVMKLNASNRITVQEAKEFGHLHGFCMVCGKTLTDPKSVEQGIGPVCIKRV